MLRHNRVTSYISIVGFGQFKNSFTMIPNSNEELPILPSFVPMELVTTCDQNKME